MLHKVPGAWCDRPRSRRARRFDPFETTQQSGLLQRPAKRPGHYLRHPAAPRRQGASVPWRGFALQRGVSLEAWPRSVDHPKDCLVMRQSGHADCPPLRRKQDTTAAQRPSKRTRAAPGTGHRRQSRNSEQGRPWLKPGHPALKQRTNRTTMMAIRLPTRLSTALPGGVFTLLSNYCAARVKRKPPANLAGEAARPFPGPRTGQHPKNTLARQRPCVFLEPSGQHRAAADSNRGSCPEDGDTPGSVCSPGRTWL